MHPRKILCSILLGLAGACALGACDRAAVPQAAAQASQPAPAPASAAAKPLSTTAKLPAPETLADTFITGQVKAALMTDPSLAGADVSVNTSRGVVSLTGRVKNREQAAIASAHAEGEDGVMRVENTLLVSAD